MPDRDKIPLTDPRVLALAQARQQLAHEGMLHPTWDELTPTEQEGSLPSARSYLEAAVRSGLVGSSAEVLAEVAAEFRRTPRVHPDYASSVRAARLIEEHLARAAAVLPARTGGE